MNGCCTMEYTAGEFGTQTCRSNNQSQITPSQKDLRLAWDHNRCVICGHPLVEQPVHGATGGASPTLDVEPSADPSDKKEQEIGKSPGNRDRN